MEDETVLKHFLRPFRFDPSFCIRNALLLLLMFGARSLGADLRGVVLDENAAPVAGATVCISRVSPKKGEGFEPTYYQDWGKKTLTDAEGKFVLENVEDEM